MVPLTMPELQPGFENRFPTDCFGCVADTAGEYITITLRFISEMVHGVGYLPGEGPVMWEDLVEGSQEFMWQYLDRQGDIPSWRNGNVPTGLLQVSFAEEAADLPHVSDNPHSDAIVYSYEGEAFWYVPVHQDDGPY